MNNIIVLTINSELNSIKELGFPTHTYLDKLPQEYDDYVILRAGNSNLKFNEKGKPVEYKNVINLAKSISLNVRKDRALRELSKIVNTPKLWMARERVPKSKMVVYRSNNHTGGEGFKVVKGGFVVKDGFHATEYIESNQEYRLYWCMGKSFLASRITDDKKLLKEKYKCRSQYGYQFWNNVLRGLHEIGVKCSNTVPLEFCCYDIIRGVKDGKYYVLEKNSCPTQGDFEIKRFYRKALLDGVKNKFPHIKVRMPKKIRKTNIDNLWQ